MKAFAVRLSVMLVSGGMRASLQRQRTNWGRRMARRSAVRAIGRVPRTESSGDKFRNAPNLIQEHVFCLGFEHTLRGRLKFRLEDRRRGARARNAAFKIEQQRLVTRQSGFYAPLPSPRGR